MNIFHNIALIAALVAIITAQGLKIPLGFISDGKWNISKAFGTGGMPSSHSAAVVSLATVVGLNEGWSSSMFAVAAVVSAITMYDAAGVRRHAGMHASSINRIAKSIKFLHPHSISEFKHDDELKELLGHRPIEVFGGAIWGIAIGLIMFYLGYKS
ncbi:divergent PAP2 family protein [Paenibacillus sp. MMO-58]|uniref:divergent PAP2 family protein n=1 Tax=Paenibacillus sp. MMO-58 TaxID=3081290 RepID=UPI0030178530